MFDKLKKNLILTVVFSSLVFFLFSALADFESVFTSIKKFNWLILPLVLLLSLGNYFVRFYKWHYYLNYLKIEIPLKLSMKIFFSGLSMSASPGKMGEVLKSFLLKEISNESISKTAPIILAERITDFLSLTFITIIVGMYFNYTGMIAYVVLVFFLIVIIFISNRKLAESTIAFFSKISFVKKHSERIITLYESSYLLIKPKPLIYMFVISVFSWSFECLGFYLILMNFDPHINLLWPVFVFSLSIIVGAISMLPGGLGVTEGSLSLILINGGMVKNNAVASTILIRIATLWFAVILGAIVLFILRKDLNKKISG